MKVKEIVPIVVSFILFGLSVAFSVLTPPKSEEPALQVAATAEEARPKQEMRGVWITYMELSMENEDNQSESAFREKFVLTGIQGETAGYDALKVMCEICGNFGLDIQAWVNPYRVTVNNVPNELCDDNIFVKHPELCIETDSGIILDPSNADARQLIEDGVLEIAESYDIDGVQFDDYFYPADIGETDYPEYMEYLDSHPSSGLSLERWRELNVNILLSEIYLRLQNCGRNVTFGISPQGNLDNNANLSADVVSWCCIKGFAD